MLTIDISEAKTHLSSLVARAAEGESFIIAKDGKPLVKVLAFGKMETGTSTRLGFMEGEFSIPDDFDRMGDDVMSLRQTE